MERNSKYEVICIIILSIFIVSAFAPSTNALIQNGILIARIGSNAPTSTQIATCNSGGIFYTVFFNGANLVYNYSYNGQVFQSGGIISGNSTKFAVNCINGYLYIANNGNNGVQFAWADKIRYNQIQGATFIVKEHYTGIENTCNSQSFICPAYPDAITPQYISGNIVETIGGYCGSTDSYLWTLSGTQVLTRNTGYCGGDWPTEITPTGIWLTTSDIESQCNSGGTPVCWEIFSERNGVWGTPIITQATTTGLTAESSGDTTYITIDGTTFYTYSYSTNTLSSPTNFGSVTDVQLNNGNPLGYWGYNSTTISYIYLKNETTSSNHHFIYNTKGDTIGSFAVNEYGLLLTGNDQEIIYYVSSTSPHTIKWSSNYLIQTKTITQTVTVHITSTVLPQLSQCKDSATCGDNQLAAYLSSMIFTVILIAVGVIVLVDLNVHDDRAYVFIVMCMVSISAFIGASGELGANAIPWYVALFVDMIGLVIIGASHGN